MRRGVLRACVARGSGRMQSAIAPAQAAAESTAEGPATAGEGAPALRAPRWLFSTAGALQGGVRGGPEGGRGESWRWQILIEAGRNYNAVSGLRGKCSWRLIRPERNRSWSSRQRRSSERQAALQSSPPQRSGGGSARQQRSSVVGPQWRWEGAEGAVARAAPLRPPFV